MADDAGNGSQRMCSFLYVVSTVTSVLRIAPSCKLRDAHRHLALWCASPSRHRTDRRGLQSPRRIHPGTTHRGIRGAFAAGRVRQRHAVTAAYGRIAFYYMLKALDLPPGSEIIFPALTFWVVPELARVAGLQSCSPTSTRRPSSWILRRSSGYHARHPRNRADAPVWAPVRHGRDCSIAARHNLASRGLRARVGRDLQRPPGWHVRRRGRSSAFRR